MAHPICQICGKATLEELPKFAELPRITSDCKPFPAGGRLAICGECAAIQKPIDARWQAEAAKIYENYEVYFQSGGVEQAVFDPQTGAPRSRSGVILERLAKCQQIAAEGKVLDVGCGNGALLSAFAALHGNWRLFGHDLSEINLEALSRIPGFEQLYTGGIDDLPGGFDILTLMHSLEHFSQPVEALKGLRSKLAPQGSLLIEVPDIEATPFDLLVADHISHFTSRDLARLLPRAGFELVFLSNDWVVKELSAVAVPGAVSEGPSPLSPTAVRRRVQGQIDWLRAVIAEAKQSAAGSHRFGLFGTSVAAMWLYGELGDAIDFFVDEDPSRRGAQLLGRRILPPAEVDAGATVFMPLIPQVARAIAHRLAGSGVDLRIPPELPT